MLPSLGRLSLNCGRCRRPQTSIGVTRQQYNANNSEECSVCFEPLSAERPGFPWHEHYDTSYSYDGLPDFIIEACENRHVFHKVCLEQAYVRAVNNSVEIACPFCKAPFKDNALRMLQNRNDGPPATNLDHPNPFAYSAPDYYMYEFKRTRMKLERMSREAKLDEDTEDEVNDFFFSHNCKDLPLEDFFPPGDIAGLTDDQARDVLDDVTRLRNATRQRLLEHADGNLLALYQEMMQYHDRILAVLMTNPRAASLMEEDAVDGESDNSDDDDSDDDSSDDSQAVPGTPPGNEAGPSSGTMDDDSDGDDPTSPDHKRSRFYVPETPPQPSPPPRDPNQPEVVIPETPPHLLNPPRN